MSLIVSNPSYLGYLTNRYAGGVYVHWNFWCNVQDPVQRDFCRHALENSPAEMVREYRERDFGIGYGRSSGYASTRQYAIAWNGQPLFRCV